MAALGDLIGNEERLAFRGTRTDFLHYCLNEAVDGPFGQLRGDLVVADRHNEFEQTEKNQAAVKSVIRLRRASRPMGRRAARALWLLQFQSEQLPVLWRQLEAPFALMIRLAVSGLSCTPRTLIVGTVIDLLRSRTMLEAEILMMRRANPERLRFASIDRLTLEVSAGCFLRCMIHLQLSDQIP